MSNSTKGGKVGRKRKADYDGEPMTLEEIKRQKGCEAARKHRKKKLDEISDLKQRNDQLKKQNADFTAKLENLRKMTTIAKTLMQQHKEAGCSLPDHNQDCELFAGNTLYDEVVSMEQSGNDNCQHDGSSPTETDENSNSQSQHSLPSTFSYAKALFSGESLPLIERSSPSPQQPERLQTSPAAERQAVVAKESHLPQHLHQSPVAPSGQRCLPVSSASPNCNPTTSTVQSREFTPTPLQTSQQSQPVTASFQTPQQSKPVSAASPASQLDQQINAPFGTNLHNQRQSVSFQAAQQSQPVPAAFPTRQQGKPLSAPSAAPELHKQATTLLQASVQRQQQLCSLNQQNHESQQVTAPYQTSQINKQSTAFSPLSQQSQYVTAFSHERQLRQKIPEPFQTNQQVSAPSQTAWQNGKFAVPFQSSQGNEQVSALAHTSYQGQQVATSFQTIQINKQPAASFLTSQQSHQVTAPFQRALQGQQLTAPFETSQQQPSTSSQVSQLNQQLPAPMSQQSQQVTPSFATSQLNLQVPAPMSQQNQQVPAPMSQQNLQVPAPMSQQHHQVPAPMGQQNQVVAPMNQQHHQVPAPMGQQSQVVGPMSQQSQQVPAPMGQQNQQVPAPMWQQDQQVPAPMWQQDQVPASMSQQNLQVPAPFHAATETVTNNSQPLQDTNEFWKVGVLQINGEHCKVLINAKGQFLQLPPTLEKEFDPDSNVLLVNESGSGSTQESQGQEMCGNTGNFDLLGNIPDDEVLGIVDPTDHLGNSGNENGLNQTENINVFENLRIGQEQSPFDSSTGNNNGVFQQWESALPVMGSYAQELAEHEVQLRLQDQHQSHILHQQEGQNTDVGPINVCSPVSIGMQAIEGQVFSQGMSSSLTMTTPSATSYTTGTDKDKNSGVSHNFINSTVVGVPPNENMLSSPGPSCSQQNKISPSYATPSTAPTMSKKLVMHLQQMRNNRTRELSNLTQRGMFRQGQAADLYHSHNYGPRAEASQPGHV